CSGGGLRPSCQAVGGDAWETVRSWPRSDVKELGELMDSDEAALLIVGASTLEAALDEAGRKAEKHRAKELDVSTQDIDDAVAQGGADATTSGDWWSVSDHA